MLFSSSGGKVILPVSKPVDQSNTSSAVLPVFWLMCKEDHVTSRQTSYNESHASQADIFIRLSVCLHRDVESDSS